MYVLGISCFAGRIFYVQHQSYVCLCAVICIDACIAESEGLELTFAEVMPSTTIPQLQRHVPKYSQLGIPACIKKHLPDRCCEERAAVGLITSWLSAFWGYCHKHSCWPDCKVAAT